MPAAIRITIALNAQQSQKAPLLLPASAPLDPSVAHSRRALVLKAASSKLRLKKGVRVFVAGTGQELLTTADWTGALRDDVTLLVAPAGEEYVGLKKEAAADDASTTAAAAAADATASSPCTVTILAAQAAVDPLSVTQVETTASTLPGLIHAVGQPDLHPGTKFPIGAVFVSGGYLHPPLIGGDIGCGMAWYRTRMPRGQVEGEKARKVAETLRGLEGAWRGARERARWLGADAAGEPWDGSLGTIGAGNHFAEVQVVEQADEGTGMRVDEVVLLVHSGSRGYGGDILRRYSTDGRVSMHESDGRAKEYLIEHDRACRWAKANRDLIALRFLACLEPGEEAWDIGLNASSSDGPAGQPLDANSIADVKAKIAARKIVDIWHNNVERVRWPPVAPPSSDHDPLPSATAAPDPGNGGGDDDDDNNNGGHAYIHRKGAAPTYDPTTQTPLPLLPLPGSRGTPTLLLTPTFSAATGHGRANGLSLAHGAGRAMSRAKALASLRAKYRGDERALLRPGKVKQQQQQQQQQQEEEGEAGLMAEREGKAVRGGTWVVCEHRDLVWEEAPEAYKDVWAVAADLEAAGAARVRGWCRARVCYKVRRE